MKHRLFTLVALLLLTGQALSQPGLWVRIASPSSGATLNGPFTLSGTATPFQRVIVRGNLKGQGQSDRNGNWSIGLDPTNLPAGQPVKLNVIAMDGSGNSSPPVRRQFATAVAGTQPPPSNPGSALLLSVNLPANGATVSDPFTVSGTATPGMLVDVTGGLQGQTYAAGDGTWSLSLGGGTPGQVVNLSIVAREGSGKRSDVVNVRYALAQPAPPPPDAPPAPPQPRLIVKVLSPLENDTVNSTFLVSGVASPGTKVDIQAVPADPVAATVLNFESTVAGGDQRYQVTMQVFNVPAGTPIDLYVRPQDGSNKVIKVRVFSSGN